MALAFAVALATAHALWSLFQWMQLIIARAGGDYFCGLGKAAGCAAVWDSPLAGAVQSATGLPVAGWGLAWSMVAFAIPLWTLVRRARGHPLEPFWTAALLTALAGIIGVVVLAAASVSLGQLCTTCAVTYAMVLVYGAICLREAERLRSAQVRQGAALALGAILVAFLALLYPGLSTPRDSAAQELAFLKDVGRPREVAKQPDREHQRPLEAPDRRDQLQSRPDAADLEELTSRLSPQLRQGLSDALASYANSDPIPLRPARQLVGPSTAPVRITEFTDILCSHCADLAETMKLLREMLPSGSFSLEPRQFPLDSECNPAVERSSENGVSCLAARAQICVSGDSMDFTDALFDNQRSLTKQKIYELAAPFMSRERLEECIASPETEQKLRDDIAWAVEHDIQGTPMVLVNGRKAPAALHFLYAIVLAEADPKHPAFAALPAPSAALP